MMDKRSLPDSLQGDELAVILAICRSGSLLGAARTLGHTHRTVYRRITAIEEKPGCAFLDV